MKKLIFFWGFETGRESNISSNPLDVFKVGFLYTNFIENFGQFCLSLNKTMLYLRVCKVGITRPHKIVDETQG